MKKIIGIIISSLFIFIFLFNVALADNHFTPEQKANQEKLLDKVQEYINSQKNTSANTTTKCDEKKGCDIPGSNAKRFENYKCAGNGGEVITIPSCTVGGIFDPADQEDVKCACCGECRISRFVGMIVLASKFILGASGVVALAIIIYGGFLWILSGGDSQKVEKGKGALTGAVIGVIIILVSWVLINFLLNVLVQDQGIRGKIQGNNLIEGLQTEFKANSK